MPTTGWQKAFASSPFEFSRVREQPSTKAAEVGRILKAEIPVEIAPDSRVADPDGTPNKWFAIRTSTWRGWIREDVVTYRLESAPAAPSTPTTPTTPPDAPAAPAATTATTVTTAPVGAREAAPAPEPPAVQPPAPERKPHKIEFTFMGTDEEVARLRAAIAASPEAFSEFVETYGQA
jgi:hypothetical protein